LLATTKIVAVFSVKYALRQTKEFGFKKNGGGRCVELEIHLSSDDTSVIIHDE